MPFILLRGQSTDENKESTILQAAGSADTDKMKLLFIIDLSYLVYVFLFELVASIVMIKKFNFRNVSYFIFGKLLAGNNRRTLWVG